ncbi:neuropeptide FF receptor 1 like 2 [Antennarius striatus]|uniref:neuropeptide FF receptor 1 like 2 n=1 Tax=Antennarius striatus TaxID=241820 RepID=UPI0035B28677
MEILEDMGKEEMEGSITTAAVMNISLHGVTNATNITISPYYQHSLLVAASYILAYLIIFLLCVVGNILMCVIVVENRHMHTVINLFILNLAISDLLVGIFCIPTTLVDNLITGWPFSSAVCKMSGFVQGVSVSASVFTLVAIAVGRFQCIVYPLQPKPSVLYAKAVIVLIWILAVAIMCPAAVALTVEKVPFHYTVYKDNFNHTYPLYMCYENFDKPQMRKIYTVVLFLHIYLLPLAIMTLMYGSIGIKLWLSVVASKKPQMRNTIGDRRSRQQIIPLKKVKVIKVLVLVALLFMLSWLPLWTLMIMADYAGLDRDQLDFLTSYIFPLAHWLAFSNSSINPIIYGYYNDNFKRGFKAVFKSRPCCCVMQCRPWRRMTRLGRKNRSVQVACRSTDFRDDSRNHNYLFLEMRNRVHNTSKFNDTAGVNRNSQIGCVVVHSEKHLSDQGLEMVVMQKKHSNDESQKKNLHKLPKCECTLGYTVT